MSHEFESGMFAAGEPAWHGLGNVLPGKIYNLDEALQLADMAWTVSKESLFYKVGDNLIEVPQRKAVIRNRDGLLDCIATVSNRYELLQNRNAFAIAEPFLQEHSCFINSIVSLCGGRKVCLVLEIEDNTREVIKDDNVKSYILIATSHDGSMSTIVKFTVVRVVCANTLAAALMSDGEWQTLRHTKNQEVKLAAIQQTMDIYKKNFEAEVQEYRLMALKPMNIESMRALLEDVFRKELTDTAKTLDIPRDEMTLEQCRITNRCLRNFTTSPDLQLDGVVGTSWAGFNAITEAIKDKSSNRETRYDAIWFGDDARKLALAKQRTLALV